jgi:RNA-directed DNA polymerase
VVWAAYQRVKANQGAAGVDEVSIEEFERDLKNNLYKLWNRMSSGSYFPPPVRTVEIPKSGGGIRRLGIPTVSDRIAQMVVKLYLEPNVEPSFHPNSYGYRPGKSAHQAVEEARRQCWRYNWVLDLDIRNFFDTIDHELMMRAVRKHTDCPWVLLYIERWLKAPIQSKDGALVPRERGTPQGSVISPVLSNLYLHYAFDAWMQRTHPGIRFERYADDVIVHCRTEAQAWTMRTAIEARLVECRLTMHPEKTKIVYCKDANRSGSYPNEKFDFLGFTFRPRKSKNRDGRLFTSFSPAVSDKAANEMRQTMRRWKLSKYVSKTLNDLARMFNPILRGWITYYGRFYKSALYRVFRPLERTLIQWATKKYKRLRGHKRRAMYWLGRIAQREPTLWAHWQLGLRPSTEP